MIKEHLLSTAVVISVNDTEFTVRRDDNGWDRVLLKGEFDYKIGDRGRLIFMYIGEGEDTTGIVKFIKDNY
jgi:hypothetical protein